MSALSARQAVLLVTRREIETRILSKMFLIFTGLMLVTVIGGSVIFTLIGGSSAVTVGVTDPALARPLAAAADALGEDVETRTVPAATGEKQVLDGELDVFVTGTATAPKAVVKRQLDPALQAALASIARQTALDAEIARTGGDPAAANRAAAAAKVDVQRLDPQAEGFGERIGLGMFAGILVYLILLVYGQTVVQGVVEEKSSRVVELLLTSIRPTQLLFGKVLGIGVVGTVQMLLVVVAGVVSAQVTGLFSIPASVITWAGFWALVWFLLGYVMYALMFAALGSLVSRQEDANGVVTPVMMLIIVPYVIGVSVLPADPDSGLVELLSLIPFFSPTLMPMRAAFDVPAWQVALTLTLTVLLIALMIQLAGRIYRNSVLRTGTRIRLADAFRDA
ncbi:ABC transporter permease [Actinomadura craniellae]|uniref:ABC transporter permease n=1 Tax=Actinomadura craniellae TaxID=2231787 RepID=A0A365H9Y6_9ACTN|nr:ABC transporter permease [Actinomadura craniellae]RAY15907.1 ABC transporter permease [Actinomadura craniellae]